MKLIFSILFMFYCIHSFSQKEGSHNDSIPTKKSNTFASFLKSHEAVPSIVSDSLNPSMLSQVNRLEEVIINSKSEFNALSLGIISKEIKPLSINERRLYTAGDFKPIHLLSILGGSLPVDPIINAINGRTKRLKKYIHLEKKENNLSFLEDHFMEYMVENLLITEEKLGIFLTYLIENENLQNIIDRKNYGELHFLIGDEWFKFKKLLNDSSPLDDNESNSENKR